MKLNNITISNVRRFGNNVSIDIEKGATVFLAPNGTGKTAIFEAIELALAKSVRRTLEKPETLIRDGMNQCSVRLDFGDDNFIQAILKKNEAPITTGNYQQFYNNSSETDIPFLLRLTHLLNQRGTDWFVQSESVKAGDQLDKLSIGRDAVMVNGLIISAKRSANTLVNQKRQELFKVEEKFGLWKELIDRKRELSSQENELRIPRKDLYATITSISNAIGNEIFEPTDDINILKSHQNALASSISIYLHHLNENLIFATSIETIVEPYLTLQKSLSSIISRLKELQLEKQVSIESQNKFLFEISKEQGSVNLQEIDLKKSEELLNQFNILQQELEKFEEINKTIAKIEAKITANLIEVPKFREHLDATKSLIDQYTLLRSREQSNTRELIQIQELEKQVLLWESLNKQSEKISNDIIELTPEINKLQQIHNEVIASKNTLETDLFTSQNSFSNLNVTSDLIKQAVNTIAHQLPPTETKCPVCLEEYLPEELRRRMNLALGKINPEIQVISDKIKLLNDKIHEIDKSELLLNENLNIVRQKLNISEKELESINSKISFARTLLNGELDVSEAKKNVSLRLKENENRKLELNEEKDKLETEPSMEQLTNKQNAIFISDTQLQQDELELRRKKLLLTESKSEIDKIKSIVSSNDKNKVAENIAFSRLKIANLKQKIEELTSALFSSKQKIASVNESISQLEKERLQVDALQMEYFARWNILKLESEPSAEALSSYKSNLLGLIDKWQGYEREIEQVKIELSRWEAAAEFFRIDDEVKKFRGEISEIEYERILLEDLSHKTTCVEDFQNKSNTLDLFSNKLTEEIDTVHERVKAINPLWKKLLKRIVIEPRFGETELNSYTHRRKQHADVNVTLHGNNTLASLVASEAQLTDLQLTFLLAMSQKYQWCPWRALLLDDPTQHHDLVHASSVFDLLRDYISIYDYQIILATHDSIQANFLMRKLENDGIPARLYKLINTDSGVNVHIS